MQYVRNYTDLRKKLHHTHGEPTTTNAHERMHEFIKSAEHYDTVEGIGTVVHQSLTVWGRGSPSGLTRSRWCLQ